MDSRVAKLISIEYHAQKSDEWLKLRGNMITASDAGTVVGDNPYETVDDFILKKCGYGEFKGNEATKHGDTYEDEARNLYCEKSGEVVHEIGLHPHPNYNWIGGSPDGLTESGKLLEIKCPLRRSLNGEIPKYYIAQVQLLMEILDLDETDFIQYKPSKITWPRPYQFTITNIKRDREWWNKNFPVMEDVWNKVLWHRENGCEQLLNKKMLKKTRRKKSKCMITDE